MSTMMTFLPIDEDQTLPVNEIFTSIDGEGKRAGELVTFVRLAGCNLRCSYCDTAYALSTKDGQMKTIEDIVRECMYFGVMKVTLTGGEPLIHKGVCDLVRALIHYGFEVNIETNGSVLLSAVMDELEGTSSFVTMDVKCPSSGEVEKNWYGNLDLLRNKDVVKFVVGSVDDMYFMLEVMGKFATYPGFYWYISPVFGKIKPSQIVSFMQEHKLFNARIQLQMHKIIWDPNMRGV